MAPNVPRLPDVTRRTSAEGTVRCANSIHPTPAHPHERSESPEAQQGRQAAAMRVNRC